MNTYVSSLAYMHKLANLSDPSKSFFIKQMLKGYKKQGARIDTRLPIPLGIFGRLLDSAAKLSCTEFHKSLFRAMCALAFYALLRVGEITKQRSGSSPPIQFDQLTFEGEGSHVSSIRLTFKDFKHNYNRRPFSITINRQTSYCPVEMLLNYLTLRGSKPGPWFVLPCGEAIPRSVFDSFLKDCYLLLWIRLVFIQRS